MALRASPFDVRALRILGLSIARTDETAADPILTLAGNWSLRDDPSHAWLMQRRLRQGDYVGSFGHADALARRREDLRPGIFRYFATAAAEDPRAVPALLQRYAVRPNWRPDFFEFLRTAENGPQVQAALVVGLDDKEGTLSDEEIGTIYMDWLNVGRIPGLLALRERTGRPAATPVVDGSFEGTSAPMPFRWWIENNPGIVAMLSEHDQGNALYILTEGFTTANVAAQLLTLRPGPYKLEYISESETDGTNSSLEWAIICVESNQQVGLHRVPLSRSKITSQYYFQVPRNNCSAQWIRLNSVRLARRTNIGVWIDDLSIQPEGDQ